MRLWGDSGGVWAGAGGAPGGAPLGRRGEDSEALARLPVSTKKRLAPISSSSCRLGGVAPTRALCAGRSASSSGVQFSDSG